MFPLCLFKWCLRIDLRSVCKAGSGDSLHLLLPAESCAGCICCLYCLVYTAHEPSSRRSGVNCLEMILCSFIPVLQTAQRLHAMCQEYLLQQLPEAARPAALAAAGHMVLDTSDAHPQHSAGPHDEDPNAMNIDNNASCTTVAQGLPLPRLLLAITSSLMNILMQYPHSQSSSLPPPPHSMH